VDALGRLEAIEEIKALKARYFRCMDTKDWAGFAEQFAPHATMDMTSENAGVTTGRHDIAAFVEAAVGDVTTVHHGHTPEIEILSDTTARGIWAMEDELRWPAGSPITAMHGYGHYHETYEKIDGRWLIASTRLTRLRVDLDKT
jgi:uncharacterized protein (TIGR02246 family)